MAKFNFWDFKQDLDDYFFEVVNIAMKTLFFIKSLTGRYDYMKKNRELKGMFNGERAFLVANGPSIKNQNLKLLKNETTFFVNRAFLHDDYEYIKPTFHVFIDQKLATGEWEIEMLDIIKKKNPGVIFLLNSKWYFFDKFKKYREDSSFKIYWVDTKLFTTPFHKNRIIDLTKITYGGAVTGVAFVASIYMEVKDFYFLGQDGNGLCYELIGEDTHFYGMNKEDTDRDIREMYKALYSMSLSLKFWTYFSDYCRNTGFNVYNCTDGGTFNMFKRVKYEDVVSE